MTYSRLVRFLLPLAITAIVIGLGSQVLSGGMARVPQAVQTLAAYGLAWGLVLFLASPLAQTKELGLVLVNDQHSLSKVRRFVVIFGVVMMTALAGLTLTRAGDWVIEGLHGIDTSLGAVVRTALFWLIPYPLLKGLSLFYAGLLLRVRRTALVSYATLANLGVSIIAVFILLPLPLIHNQPIRLPVLVIYAGLLVEMGVVVWGYRRHRAQLFAAPPRFRANEPKVLSYLYIIRFFWPLALIMLIQELSRPIINLFISRGPDATEALAILAVLYSLGRIPYGWLNEIRNLASAFREEKKSMVYIRKFAVGCAIVSLAMMVLLFWTPLRDTILESLIGVDPSLAARGHTPLLIFSLFSVVVTMRAYYHGIGLVERRTQAMAPSAPARIAAILLALLTLPYLGVAGATLGIAALFSGFVAETAAVWWGVRGREHFLSRAQGAWLYLGLSDSPAALWPLVQVIGSCFRISIIADVKGAAEL